MSDEVPVSVDAAQRVSVEVYKGAEETTPDYFRAFLEANAGTLSVALRDGNQEALNGLLQQLAGILPKNASFREIAALVGRQKNGNILVTTAEGNIDRIDSQKTGYLLDDVIEAFAGKEIEQIFFVHTHPSEQHPIFGAMPAREVGFSAADENFLSALGAKLRVHQELQRVYTGLATANTNRVVLNEGRNQGLAWGWRLNPPQIS